MDLYPCRDQRQPEGHYHYLCTGDKAFLEDHWDEIKDATLFFESFLTRYRQWITTNPSASPENSYKNGSVSGAMTIGATIDNSIVWELFTNIIEISKILGGKDKALIKRVTELRSKLPPFQISKTTGGIQEWIDEFRETNAGHRHVSHLYGLYPGREITPENTTLFQAAQTSVTRRLEYEPIGATRQLKWKPQMAQSTPSKKSYNSWKYLNIITGTISAPLCTLCICCQIRTRISNL
jgi:alpha-L-fucosidase 2